MTAKPNVNSAGEKELEKAKKQIDAFENQVKEMTLDRMNQAPKLETEPQTKLAQSQIEKNNDLYLKPKITFPSRKKFDEKFRDKYEYDRQYVNFIAENKEIIGESIEFWSKPYVGTACEQWSVPVNTPVWAPRYVAEQISRCRYHRLVMKNTVNSSDTAGQYYGSMAADSTIQRLDATPVKNNKSIFMGASNF